MNGTRSSAVAKSAPVTGRDAALGESGVRELLRITRSMLVAAHTDDWTTVTCHDRARRELLDAVPASTRGTLPADLVEALLAADRALLERARHAREAVVDDTHRVRTERDARATYSRVMHDGEHDWT